MTESTRPQRISDSTAEALRRGDRHAFEELFGELRGDVYNLAARIVGDRGEAEDITQEVFLRAFRHLPGKKDQLRPEAWVFRTAVNACYDHLRRKTPTPVEALAERRTVAHDAFEQAATAAAVEQALGRLNPRYRTALVLKDLHGLGNAEIAEVMGVSRGTIGVLLFRARSSFEKRYRELAPTLGAGLPAAGLVAWLPRLPVPESLLSPPAFLAPLAGPASAPIAAVPLAPAAAAPLAAGLAKLAGALTTKVAVVAIAATAVTGGSIAAHEARDVARPPVDQTTVVVVAPLTSHEAVTDTTRHARTHAALTAGPQERSHDGAGHNGDLSGTSGGTRAGSGWNDGSEAGYGTASTEGGVQAGIGTQASGSGAGDGTASGDGTRTGDSGSSDGGTQTGEGTESGGAQSGDGGQGSDAGTSGGTQNGGEPPH